MGKAERNRRLNAQQKIAAQQAAARRAENRRRGLIAGGSVVLVIAIVAVFFGIKAGTSPAKATASSPAGASQPASVTNAIANIPAATLASVGTGTTSAKAVVATTGNPAPLTSNGKPVVVYVGGEYCPYCAAERWALTAALSKFGSFSHLGFIHSSSSDVDPSTPTLTYYKSSYTSKYIDFQPTEAVGLEQGKNLETMTSLDNELFKKFNPGGSFPFVDIGNKYLITGASYDPGVLKGLTWAQVAAALKDPTSPVAKGVDGATNLITAALCKITGGQPDSVCTSAGVTKASGAI